MPNLGSDVPNNVKRQVSANHIRKRCAMCCSIGIQTCVVVEFCFLFHCDFVFVLHSTEPFVHEVTPH